MLPTGILYCQISEIWHFGKAAGIENFVLALKSISGICWHFEKISRKFDHFREKIKKIDQKLKKIRPAAGPLVRNTPINLIIQLKFINVANVNYNDMCLHRPFVNR